MSDPADARETGRMLGEEVEPLDRGTPRNRETRTRQRRAEIVQAATQIFAERGFSNVGMRDIADAVGIRGASLYHHFPSKEEILFAICLTVTREPVEENLPLLDAAGTPSERLANLVRAHIRHLRRRRLEHLVGVHERACLTPEHLAETDEYRVYYHRRVHDLLTAGMRSGEFREMNPKITTLGILDMLNGVSAWVRGDSDADVEEIAETYLRLIFDGLRP